VGSTRSLAGGATLISTYQEGGNMRRFIERYTSNPIRGLGRIVRGNVRQGLRDMAPAAKIAAAFIPGGALASAGLGAAAGALEQERGASARDIVGGAVRGAGTATALRGAQQQVRGMLTGGGAGGVAASPAGGAPAGGAQLSSIPGLDRPATASMSELPRLARSTVTDQTSRSFLGGLGGAAKSVGQFSRDYPDLAGGVARGAGTAFAGARQAGALEREIALQERQDERAAAAEEEERRRRIRVAQMLAPLFQQMQQQYNS